MSNWYGIDGIEFIYRGPWDDPAIRYKGVTDTKNIDAEDMMYAEFLEEGGTDGDYESFGRFMLDNAESVKDFIEECRLADQGLL